eukprot:4074728-Pleurochrysis_carterae.AAC.1
MPARQRTGRDITQINERDLTRSGAGVRVVACTAVRDGVGAGGTAAHRLKRCQHRDGACMRGRTARQGRRAGRAR